MITILAAASGSVSDVVRETADMFGWNWKLFLSQVISFCIVAYLLQRFAYKPILAVLEQRRRTIEEGQINAEKIKKELAEAEKRYQEIVAKANADGQKMVDEARESAAHLSERKQQEAITAAEQIIAKAREAAAIEHDRTMESLKREVGRLVVDTRRPAPFARRSSSRSGLMKLNKEIRQLSRKMLQASFTDGQLDPGRITTLVDSVIAEKPRNYIDLLKNYKRLLRLEVEKRRATIETASEVNSDMRSDIVANLKSKYGNDLATEFYVDPQLLGGMRIRVGNDVWDGSVRNRLERLQHEL
jgi:ATP synthase F0 subunit b